MKRGKIFSVMFVFVFAGFMLSGCAPETGQAPVGQATTSVVNEAKAPAMTAEQKAIIEVIKGVTAAYDRHRTDEMRPFYVSEAQLYPLLAKGKKVGVDEYLEILTKQWHGSTQRTYDIETKSVDVKVEGNGKAKAVKTSTAWAKSIDIRGSRSYPLETSYEFVLRDGQWLIVFEQTANK